MHRPGIIHRLRHFRGHGIHSPFVYRLKRDVFMKKRLDGENMRLYNTLIDNGIGHKAAKDLQNLHNYCSFTDFEILESKNPVRILRPDIFYIAAAGSTRHDVERMIDTAGKSTVAVIGKNRREEYRGGNIKIQRRHYTLIFKDSGMPVQTFKL